jgi:hypothetical protein
LQSGRLKLEISEVDHNALSHNVATNEYIDLLEKASALSVANFIIHVDCIVGMIHCHLYGMRCPLCVVVQGLPKEVKAYLMGVFDIAEFVTLS